MDAEVLYRVITGACQTIALANESDRIKRAAYWLHWDSARLYYQSHDVLQQIPVVGECKELVEEATR